MAHSQKLALLADQLLKDFAYSKNNVDVRTSRRQKDDLLKALKSKNFASTNHFEVYKTLEGLVEKFEVLRRESLAAAIQERVENLSRLSFKWTPEVLALFLELSDRPVEKTGLEALATLKPARAEPQLTWADIVADDPIIDDDLWRDIDYSERDSSVDASYVSDVSDGEADHQDASSWTEEASVCEDLSSSSTAINEREELLELQETLRSFAKATSDERLAREEVNQVTELVIIREVIFLLRSGYSFLFHSNSLECSYRYIGPKTLSHTSASTVEHLMAEVCSMTTSYRKLLAWCDIKQATSVQQRFQHGLRQALSTFDSDLNKIESSLVGNEPRDFVASLLHTETHIRRCIQPVLALKRVVVELEAQCDHPRYECLDLLYKQICLGQSSGDSQLYRSLCQVFLPALQAYLYPVHIWMRFGIVDIGEECFFVRKQEAAQFQDSWQESFEIRRLQDGQVDAPQFLQSFSQQIYISGKSVFFLHLLNGHSEQQVGETEFTDVNFDTLATSLRDVGLSPFEETLADCLEEWFKSRQNLASTMITTAIFDDCKLLAHLNALNAIYLSKDGALFSRFCERIFCKIDERSSLWNDRYLIVELAQEIYASELAAVVHNISARTGRVDVSDQSLQALRTITLEYTLPWAITNIINSTHMECLRRVFTFLLQIHRSEYALTTRLAENKHSFSPRIARALARPSNLLRFHMIRFVKVLHFHLTAYVIEPASLDVQSSLAKADNLDEMGQVYGNYAANMEQQCLVSKNMKPIYSAILQMLELSLDLQRIETQHQARSEVTGAKRSTQQSKSRMRRPGIGNSLASKEDSDSDASEELDASHTSQDYDADTESPKSKGTYEEKISRLTQEHEKLLRFIIAGLKSAGRVKDHGWTVLAERLEGP